MKRLLQEGQLTLQSNMTANVMKHNYLLLMAQEFPSSDTPGWNLFRQDWPSINLVTQSLNDDDLNHLIDCYDDVFSDTLGKLNGPPAKLHVHETAVPVHQKFRSVPFASRQKVEVELEKLRKQGIISSVTRSEWATPVVPAFKKNGSVRLYGDFKVTVNPQFVVETYPLPTLDDLQEKMNGGCLFFKA